MSTQTNHELFVLGDNLLPLCFTIYRGSMLQIKYNQLGKKIVDHGGVFKAYNEQTKKTCIVLVDEDDPTFEEKIDNMFSINYIVHCIRKNKLLALKPYRISRNNKSVGNKSESRPVFGKRCPDFDLLTLTKCEHLETPTMEEELTRLETILNSC
ncbi:uncharacterized protein LOC106647377 [Copidosoma floridanum]|uniref:uncharacterized protein LOC106647377 n=1 Tax=Copidosoma floridanum TaxID=29053 RepID=UPI0006C9A5C4|nr:uncharacterized protein LOC106647377 [Copidosoma floridanum]